MPRPRSVVVYSPDRHICYDGETPDRTGVGGGIVVRVRLAAALAALGHEVTHVCHTPRERVVDGVRYLPLDAPGAPDAPDVFLAQSSGDRLDLTPAAEPARGARLRLASIAGQAPVRGRQAFAPHAYVVPSRFLARHLVDHWDVPATDAHVVPLGVVRDAGRTPRVRRDPHRLVYASHPSKGLAPALALLAELRRADDRFTLHVYGGAQLWGGPPAPVQADGVVDHGLVGQRELAAALRKASYSVHLQDVEEGFGLTLSEAMSAGCIPVASPVGAFPERAHDGVNAVVVPGAPVQAVPAAASAVRRLTRSPLRRRVLQHRARRSVQDWRTSALGVTALVEGLLGGGRLSR